MLLYLEPQALGNSRGGWISTPNPSPLSFSLHLSFPSPCSYDTCQSTPISGPGEPVGVRRYNTHHMFSPPAVGGS